MRKVIDFSKGMIKFPQSYEELHVNLYNSSFTQRLLTKHFPETLSVFYLSINWQLISKHNHLLLKWSNYKVISKNSFSRLFSSSFQLDLEKQIAYVLMQNLWFSNMLSHLVQYKANSLSLKNNTLYKCRFPPSPS